MTKRRRDGPDGKSAAHAKSAEHERGLRFVKFLTAAVTPFHAVHVGSKMLEEAGFARLEESDPWRGTLRAGGKYYYTRCDSTLVAFSVGPAYQAGGGFKVVGAHTDSPALKTKPLTLHGAGNADGMTQVSVVTYGGGLWHTWFDRDLGIGGMVLTRARGPDGKPGPPTKRLLTIDEPVLRVPSLCIHLQTAAERESFAPNKESHLAPVICLAAERQLGGSSNNGQQGGVPASGPPGGAFEKKQEPELMQLMASRLGVEPEDIASFDLTLFDAQAPALGGTHSEFVLGGRLDNLASCFVALEALIDAAASPGPDDGDISCIALFDHEEVGSSSNQGAGGPVMKDAIDRISEALGAPAESEVAKMALRKSFIVSLDNAHAVHPNYRSKHEGTHRPVMGGGCVIKSNANMRYATDSITSYIVRELASRASAPVQEFVVKNDCPCGSTIGPIIASSIGVRTCDIGMPQLSMHSVREMMGTDDLTHCYKLLGAFFKEFSSVDDHAALNPAPVE